MSDTYPRVDPRAIVINREDRQRQENIEDVADLKLSISKLREQSPETGGLIHPIVVRLVDGKLILIAGERRLKAFLELDLPDVPYRMFETLSHLEAEVIELEENVKRRELAWKDQVKSVARIHKLHRQLQPGWKIEQTAEFISLHHSQVRKILHVADALNTGRISNADSIEQAYNTIQRFAERKAESIVGDLIVKGAAVFGNATKVEAAKEITAEALLADEQEPATQAPFVTLSAVATWEEEAAQLLEVPEPTSKPVVLTTASTDPIICAEFGAWAANYSGPKFTLIHCDFPYGNYKGNDSSGAMSVLETEDFYDNTESVYWNLLDLLTAHLDKLMSYSAHLVFWFNMNFYTETVARLRKSGLMVHDHPLVWHKTPGGGGLGVAPGTVATHPRRTYDTALLAVRGNRPLVRSMCNSYACPTVSNKIHPSQKPDSMLRYFLTMVVDETTTVLDPTCGSAAALRAAEDLGAKGILGIEMDPNYAASANSKTLQARILRQAGAMQKADVA